MALRAAPPSEVPKHAKVLFVGGPGTGKTFSLTQIPHSYFFDLERGAEYPEYAKHLLDGGSVVFSTVDIDEVINEVTSLLSERHPYRNVVIDPITTVFNDEADVQEKRLGTDYGKNTAEANRKWRRLGKLLKRLQMNVFVTAYAKKGFGDDAQVTANGPKDIEHFFDVVIRAEKRGEDRVAVVTKSRSRAFKEGSSFLFTYEEIAARLADELAREAEPIALATVEQVSDLGRLLSLRVDGEQLKDKWLKKAGAEELSEMPAEAAAKCIAFLQKGSESEPAEKVA